MGRGISGDILEGAASLLTMLEDKADNQRITASELAAVRCIVETCAANLDGVLPPHGLSSWNMVTLGKKRYRM